MKTERKVNDTDIATRTRAACARRDFSLVNLSSSSSSPISIEPKTKRALASLKRSDIGDLTKTGSPEPNVPRQTADISEQNEPLEQAHLKIELLIAQRITDAAAKQKLGEALAKAETQVVLLKQQRSIVGTVQPQVRSSYHPPPPSTQERYARYRPTPSQWSVPKSETEILLEEVNAELRSVDAQRETESATNKKLAKSLAEAEAKVTLLIAKASEATVTPQETPGLLELGRVRCKLTKAKNKVKHLKLERKRLSKQHLQELQRKNEQITKLEKDRDQAISNEIAYRYPTKGIDSNGRNPTNSTGQAQGANPERILILD